MLHTPGHIELKGGNIWPVGEGSIIAVTVVGSAHNGASGVKTIWCGPTGFPNNSLSSLM